MTRGRRSPPSLSLKLLVYKSENKVLFAEAGKEFVDFLFTLLALPVGTAAGLLTGPHMVGSVGNVYSSLKSMDATYLQPNLDKEMLLHPKIDARVHTDGAAAVPLLLPSQLPPEGSNRKRYYGCSTNNYGYGAVCGNYVTEVASTPCPGCKRGMNRALEFVDPGKDVAASVVDKAPGYVQPLTTYMITDDLSVSPMSSISGITLLNRFNVTDLRLLEERIVAVGMDEGRKLLKASLSSKTVLTDVFLLKNFWAKDDV